MRRIVSNTGPLLHLSEAQSVDLLSSTGEVYIPRGVEVEVVHHLPKWHNPAWLMVDLLVEPYSMEAVNWQQAGLLDAGEAEVTLERLAQSSLWLSASVLNEAITALDQLLQA